MIVDVTIPRRSFVFGPSRAQVSAGFTNVRSLAVAAFHLVYCPLPLSQLKSKSNNTVEALLATTLVSDQL